MAVLSTFRAKAVLKLQSPDQLDQRVRVVKPWTWLVLLGLCAMITGVVVWASLATLPTSISAVGYVTPATGWLAVQAPVAGTVESLDAATGRVRPGEVVATIAGPGSTVTPVVARTAGVIAESSVEVGEYVDAGDQLAIVAPVAGSMVVQAFFPVDASRQIAPGVATDISVGPTPPAAFGFLRGRVLSVGSLPVTQARLDELLLDPTLAAQVAAHGPVVEVVIALDRARTASGLSWSLGGGPPYQPLSGGLATRVSIVVDRQHPMAYVF